MWCMSEMTQISAVPEWDLADRLAKSLRQSGVAVGEMSTYLSVNRNTVGRYTNGHTKPSRATILAWAMRTGVPVAWLEHGVGPAGGGGEGERARRDSNSRPED